MDGRELVRQIEVKLSELGMKKKEFYALTGISSAAFSYWNTGRSKPSLDALTRIDAVLGTQFSRNWKTLYPLEIQGFSLFFNALRVQWFANGLRFLNSFWL